MTEQSIEQLARRVPVRRAHKPNWQKLRRSEAIPGLAFLAPFLVFLIVFQYVPLILLGRASLMEYSLINQEAGKFVGLDNYARTFTDPDVLQTYRSTGIFIIGMLILTVPVGLLLGIYLDKKMPARGLVRVMVFLPVLTSSVVTSTIFGFILGQPGLLNEVLQTVGIDSRPFLTDPTWARGSLIFLSSWQEIGLTAILFLGGLQAIPEDVREAARIDGVGWWTELLYITVPLLSRTTMFVVVLVTVFALQSFAPALLLTAGGPQGSTSLITFTIYQTAFQLDNPGLAAATSVILLVFALAVSGLQMRLLRSRWNY